MPSWWDAAICNAMISVYVSNGLTGKAEGLFLSALRKGFCPTEFTFSSILKSSTGSIVTAWVAQIHSMEIKLGFESEMIVASSLLDMYSKVGLIEAAIQIFNRMEFRDLAVWNTMIMGLAENGQGREALTLFNKLEGENIWPDRITLMGLLSACNVEDLFEEGMRIFVLLKKKYHVSPGIEHYSHITNMLARAGLLDEALEMLERVGVEHDTAAWVAILESCLTRGHLKVAELVALKMMDLNSHSSLPYMVLAQIYGSMSRWECVARVKRSMKERGVKNAFDCSWIGVRNHVFAFEADQFLHYGGDTMYSILKLLIWETREWISVHMLSQEL